MGTTCTRCEGTGFLNYFQVEDMSGVDILGEHGHLAVLEWIENNSDHDVQVCDCCGCRDGYGWYGEPGEHYNNEDPPGPSGPYAYNGGLCECH